jgi:hypothetical protein
MEKKDHMNEAIKFNALCAKGDANGCMNMIKEVEHLLKLDKMTFVQFCIGSGTPLENAICAKMTNVCMELLKYPRKCRLQSVPTDKQIRTGRKTPLKLACQNKMERVCMEMVKHPELCDLNRIITFSYIDNIYIDKYKINNEGYTQLMAGCKYGFSDLCMKILDYPDLRMDTLSYVNIKNESALSLAHDNKMWTVYDKIKAKLEQKQIEMKKKQILDEFEKAVTKAIEQYPKEVTEIMQIKCESAFILTPVDMPYSSELTSSTGSVRTNTTLPSPAKEIRIPFLSPASYDDIMKYIDSGDTDSIMNDAVLSYAVKLSHDNKATNMTEKRKFDNDNDHYQIHDDNTSTHKKHKTVSFTN